MDSNGENKYELMGKKGDFLSKLKGLGSLSLDSLTTQQLKKTGPEDKVERPEDKVERPGNEWEIDLSKLELKHQLAQGTYGIVYKGIYNGYDVAVKLLEWGEDRFAHNAKTAALRESFLKEVAVWHKLNHPNVAKFIGASIRVNELKIPQKNPTINDRKPLPKRSCCVVVEFVPGGTLKQFLIRHSRKKLAYKTAINLALDLSRGLSYLHSQKIVHRDVKTENMLLDRQGNLKIVDFGVARVEAENPDEMTGETGTLSYMAPEVVEGKPYNRKCDVYSFGICLWEIYCCDMPYCFLTFEALSYAVVRQNLRPDIPKCCPSALANVMMRCWDPSPDKRPEMDEVVRLLEAINTSKGGGMLPEGKSSKCPCFATPIWGL